MKEITLKSATQKLIDRIQHYLTNSNLDLSLINIDGDILTIAFLSSERKIAIPTEEQLSFLKNLCYWTDVLDVPYIDKLFEYDTDNNMLRINIKSYDICSDIYHQMKKFGVCVKSFDYKADSFITFLFTLSGRNVLNYEELEILQNIINPNIKRHDSIRVMGCSSVYNLHISL